MATTTKEIFSQEELDRFHHHDAWVQTHKRPNTPANFVSHQKTYLKGYFCCTNCHRWFHPNNEEDTNQIVRGKNGYRLHKNCPVRSISPAALKTVPRHHKTRKKRLDEIKRY